MSSIPLPRFSPELAAREPAFSAPISGSEEMIFTAKSGSVAHPLTGKQMAARPLFGKITEVDEESDLRVVLADWITSPDNPYFARVIVNRVWADLMGGGVSLSHQRFAGNQSTHESRALGMLADDFRKNKYDLKKLLRTIMTSRVYSLSSIPTDRNAGDLRNYSRYYRQRLRAEVLLDAVSDITGVSETFAALPQGLCHATLDASFPVVVPRQLWAARSESGSALREDHGFVDGSSAPFDERSRIDRKVTSDKSPTIVACHEQEISEGNRRGTLSMGLCQAPQCG